MAPRTYLNRLCALKLFSKWSKDNDLWPRDYLEKYVLRAVSPDLPTYLDDPEQIMDLAALFNPTEPFEMRNRAMLLVSYSGAFRAGELFNLKLSDYLPHSDPPALNVRTLKRGNHRQAMLFPMAQQALEEYLGLSRSMIVGGRPDPKWLFVSNAGKQLSLAYWNGALKDLGKAYGLTITLTSHVLRHSFATHSAREGWSIFRLQQYLGHKAPSSTAVYVHMTDKDVIDQFKKSSYFARSVNR